MKKLWIVMLACCVAFISCDKDDDSSTSTLGGDTASALQGYWSSDDGYVVLNFEDDVCYVCGTKSAYDWTCTYSFDSPDFTIYFWGTYDVGSGTLSSDSSSITFSFEAEDDSYVCYYMGSDYSADEESDE